MAYSRGRFFTRAGFAEKSDILEKNDLQSPSGEQPYFSEQINLQLLENPPLLTPENFEQLAGEGAINDYEKVIRIICNPADYSLHFAHFAPINDPKRFLSLHSRYVGTSKGRVTAALERLGFSVYSSTWQVRATGGAVGREIVYADFKSAPQEGDLRHRLRSFGRKDAVYPHPMHSVFYENVFRRVCLTSRFLPWESYIQSLKAGKEIPVTCDTVRFIACYDYRIPYAEIADMTDLELCQRILLVIRNIGAVRSVGSLSSSRAAFAAK